MDILDKVEFLCVGFSKCGTTTLYEIMKQNKNIYLPEIKETLFMTIPELYKKGIDWYWNRYYSQAKEGQIVGEINPRYTNQNWCARIKKHYRSDTKLIFMMRNPVDKLYSHFRMETRVGRDVGIKRKFDSEAKEFERFVRRHCWINKKDGSVRIKSGAGGVLIHSGMYYKIVSEYMEYFKKENMKFILFEEFIRDTERYTKEIFDFIGVRGSKGIDYNISVNAGNLESKGKYALYFNNMIRRLREKYVEYMPSCMDKTFERIYPHVFNLTMKPIEQNEKMYSDTRIALEKVYREDVKSLGKLINRDLKEIWFE